MAIRSSGVGDYSRLAQQADLLEGKGRALLDELVDVMGRAQPPELLAEQARSLASEAERLAHSLSDDGELEINERTVVLQTLSTRAGELLAQAPDAIISADGERWSEEMEDAKSHLQRARTLLSALPISHLSLPARRAQETRARAHLAAAGRNLRSLHEGIHLRADVLSHPIVKQLHRIRSAMEGVRVQLSNTQKRRTESRLEQQTHQLLLQMQFFFSTHLNGRLFVDGHVIQLRSDLTGQVQEWPHDELNGRALSALLSGTELAAHLASVRNRRSSLAARFECKPSADGLMVELDAGERTILGGTILYKPQISRIMI